MTGDRRAATDAADVVIPFKTPANLHELKTCETIKRKKKKITADKS